MDNSKYFIVPQGVSFESPICLTLPCLTSSPSASSVSSIEIASGDSIDIAIHPEDENTWYLAVGSGNVWKTENAGVTWTPIFDDQGSYSIGCVSIDPNNPNIVWVGTGEDLGGRHFGYGDGIYRSEDGGKSWKNMGLKNSERISKIVIHPNDSNTCLLYTSDAADE